MLTDISLVAQVAVFGNGRAFDELVRRYQSPVRRFFLNQTLGDSQLSDDLSQDTFIKAYTNIRSFRGLASFQTWLMRIAYNVFYDYVRREKGKVNSEQFSSDGPAVERVAAANSSFLTSHSSFKMDLYAALALLKPDERTALPQISIAPLEPSLSGSPCESLLRKRQKWKSTWAACTNTMFPWYLLFR